MHFTVFQVVTDEVWDNCFWYHSQTNTGVLDEKDSVCKQLRKSPGDGTNYECQNSTLKSTFLLGGPVASRQACELHISNFNFDDNGFWRVEVARGSSDEDKNDRDYFQMQARGF